ncbi:FAD-dependent monooxygenase [Micromonospora sp. CPCC 205371]|nr:FAD-dependent monooxygenase [Micromonospora sp. CPCC 205371]
MAARDRTGRTSDGTVDVLIVGAGPTGLALAAQLAAFDVPHRVIDRAPDRVHESRALAIQPRTLEVLAGLGVTERLVAAGNRGVRLCLHAGRRAITVPLFDLGLADTAYPYLLFLSQADTEQILVEHLTAVGVAVERRVELAALVPRDDGVRCELTGGDGTPETVTARYVVGCDGAHSTVRRLAGIPFTGGSYPQTFVLADLDADGLEPDTAHAFLSGRGILLFFPLGHPATWRLLAARPPTDPTPPDAPVALTEVQAITDAYTDGTVRLREPVWMTNFRLHHRAADRYRSGRIFLAGDAAHIHSPAGAQGMNTGIQDAVNLGWKLAHALAGVADPALLDSYETERAPIGRLVLRFTDRAFTVATSTNPVVRFARTRIAPTMLPLAMKIGRGRAYAFRTVAQLAISYRRSPLSTGGPHSPRHGPRAGDRLPDSPLVHDGRHTTVHELTAAPGWHLLLAGTGDVSPTPARGLHVHRIRDATASRRCGITNTICLIRPDGHIGYRSGVSNVSGLAAYLARWLPS